VTRRPRRCGWEEGGTLKDFLEREKSQKKGGGKLGYGDVSRALHYSSLAVAREEKPLENGKLRTRA